MKCTECQMDGFHKMDCGSKILMMDYEAFVSKLSNLPYDLLIDLITRSNTELTTRNKSERFVSERTESLFDMYVRKELE